MKIVSSIQEIVHLITSHFECVQKDNNYMISDIKDLMEETYDLISDLRVDISTIQKKVDSLNVEFHNINQYEHGDKLVILKNIILQGTPTENRNDNVHNYF